MEFCIATLRSKRNEGALNALSSFTLEQISEYIPEEFKDENTEMDQFNQISGITEFKNCFWPRKI